MTYTIHRYPAELIDVVHLADGQRVIVRPVLPQDADIMQAFVQSLSNGSRRNRFFRTLHELPPDLLRRFTQVDYHQHLALLAEVFIDGVEVIVGEGRYVVDEGGTSAEFAVAVADGWQGKGIGRLLVERLECRAAAEGISRLHGETLLTNRAMQHLARSTGFTASYAPRAEGVLRLEKQIGWTAGSPWAGPGRTGAAEPHRAVPA